MSIIYGTREAATIGAPSQITITYPTPQETLLGSPVALPTSEPGSPQISITVQASDLPTVAGMSRSDTTLIPFLYVAGTNESATLHTHYARVFRNGVEVGSAAVADDAGSLYWTLSLALFAGIAAGDVITISVWASSAGLTYDYSAMAVMVSRPDVAEGGDILLNVAYAGVAGYPTLTEGAPGVYSTDNALLITSGASLSASINADRTFGALEFDAAFAFLFIVAFGDPENQPRSVLGVSTDTRPYYLTNKVPTSVAWLGTSIRVTS
jgi:hypothetical protein